MLKRNLSSTNNFLVVVTLVALSAVPLMVREYHLEIMTMLLINLILAQSYRLVTTSGDWTLSHVVLMGCGSYATAIIAKYLGWPFWATLPLSGIAAAVIGFAIAFPLLRTKGFGFFIASFALGEFVRLIWIKFHFPFGGPRGMIGIPPVEIGEIDFYEASNFYYLTLIITLVCLFVMFRIDRSRIGNALKSIYSDDELAECVGINVSRLRLQGFLVSAFFAGIAGGLLAHRLGAIDPHNFTIETMVYLIIWVVVGGTATFWGPIIGVVSMTFIFEFARPLHEWRPLLFGVILILSLILMPGGLESLFPRMSLIARRILGRTEAGG